MPRYIDADEFKNGVMYAMTENSAKDGALPLQIGMMLCNFADDTPTADVQEVKHGYWKWYADSDKAYCSCCSHGSKEAGDYCGGCGAKIDLEGGDGE